MYNKHSDSLDPKLEHIPVLGYKLGPRVSVGYNSFNQSVISSRVFKDLGLNSLADNHYKLEEHSWIDFPSEKKKRRCHEIIEFN